MPAPSLVFLLRCPDVARGKVLNFLGIEEKVNPSKCRIPAGSGGVPAQQRKHFHDEETIRVGADA